MPIWSGKARQQLSSRGILRASASSLVLALASSLFLGAGQSAACPALMLVDQLPFHRSAGTPKRSELQLYAFKGGSSAWAQIPLQLDPLDKDGSLIFPEDKDWFSKKIDPRDRISFNVEDFGKRFDGKTPTPCAHTQWLEISEHGRYAYLFDCRGPSLRQGNFESPVVHDEKQRVVGSPYYRFRYSERNHLVFDEIQIKTKDSEDFLGVASRSDLVIVGDVKNFFTMVFDAENFDARIVQKRSGPLGLMGGLEFFLKILAFKIELALMPEVNFFHDALFMPMTMYLPVDAKKYLRRGSGVYYTWESSPEMVWLFQESKMEELDLATIDPDNEGESKDKSKGDGARPPAQYCDEQRCRFSLVGKMRERRFVMDFIISRQAADLGFFPRLIRDTKAVEKQLGRPVSRFEKSSRMGIYFESARLPKGTHAWDFWIYFPETGSDCEHKLSVRRVEASRMGYE